MRKPILVGISGDPLDFDCKTSDASAKVTLWKRKELGVVTNIPEGNRVKLNGQVFSIYNLTLSDGGLFYCKASDSNGQKIQEDIGLLFISQGKNNTYNFRFIYFNIWCGISML